jgi:hypothetical protein
MCARADRFAFLWITCLVAGSCATPIAPTGGEPDRTAPQLEYTIPTDGSTGFTGDRIELRFDEYVDLNSFRNALRFEPDLNITFSVKWRGTRAIVRLDEPLPANTTVVMVLETSLRDVRSNAIPAPIRIAFSSGDRIDKGEVNVKLTKPETGRRVENVNVFLYKSGTSLTEAATYTSQTDTGGYVRFRNLPADTFRMIAVSDLNRNRILDEPREQGYAFSHEFITVAEDSTYSFGEWFITRPDTVRPVLEGIGLMGPDRIRLRFSKSVEAGTGYLVSETDTLTIHPLHPESPSKNAWFYGTERPVTVGQRYSPFNLDIADSLDNPFVFTELSLDAEELPDTIRLRYLYPEPRTNVEPTSPIEFVFSRNGPFIDFQDSLSIVADRQPFDAFTMTSVRNRLILTPDDAWPEGATMTIRLLDPSTQVSARPNIRVNRSSDKGDLAITAPDSASTFVVELRTPSGLLVRRATGIDQLLLNDIPIGTYLVVGFLDANENNRFDAGSITPFVAPEKMVIERNVSIRAGFEAELAFR